MKYASVIGDSIIRFYADYVGIKDRNELTTHLKRVQALLNEVCLLTSCIYVYTTTSLEQPNLQVYRRIQICLLSYVRPVLLPWVN
ncbi:hypothetical protein PHYBLDRAFT_160584 [Phycomyces blakesleeanus NRRL 1555(-)]|uniref:Uncharacterized protein n=1 Tax=Phycomyces blakesleeanus (strain ATCC 8743b / DSM 1359 / FGSC 10004 / NBRC 33097 / NRRL 1555) TaxID=763407 RepID=A0A167JQW1_PHYB8|nr:hypothetical protein PHYBLDRAFT_160584 [Phycomyces blakesleeanus NRRL 1555(-)]OAD66519.1 hypothetical protein PHYBLDRAFT_160584 [Phycomyces blakesleeanus NRRL 1555(-)]|eukprot:XP_018284559.1 hypothetical protein PHYBLDRAFT_160584 [Phycomyces blakesleeanus NRRL 1555(-)]